MYSFEVNRIAIIIIESLYPDERQTGEELEQGLLKYKMLGVDKGEVLLFKITSRAELFDVLRSVKRMVEEEFVFPFLHFEIHGYDDGICTINGDCISWRDILPFLMEINILLRNGLLLILGVCKGVSLVKYIGIMERAPFRMLVGSGTDISAGDIIEGFHAFYDKFFYSTDLYESTLALRERIGSDVIGLEFIENLYDEISNPRRDPDWFRNTVNERVEYMIAKNPELRSVDRNILNHEAELFLEGIFAIVKSEKDKFLMKDLIDPEMKKKEDELYGKPQSN